MVQVPQLQRTDYLDAGRSVAAAVFAFGAVVTVAVQYVTAADAVAVTAVVFQSAAAAVAVVAAVVLYAAAAAELAVAVGVVEMFVIDALVVYAVAAAVAAAGPPALLTAFVRGHCFVVD